VFRMLMKQDFNQHEETISNMISLLNGSPHTEKQINILTYLLNKIKMEQYDNSKMDEILNLFVVLYLKCKREV
jgi:hypothetical protein